MKKSFRILSILLTLTLLLGTVPALATETVEGQPQGYWPYCDAYNQAVESGDMEQVIKTGDAMLEFYSNYTLNSDIAKMETNIYNYRYEQTYYEKKGDYAGAIDNLEKLKSLSDYLGSTELSGICAARIKKLDPMTEVYLETTDTSAAVNYGAKYEPTAGTYIGRATSFNNSQVENANEIGNEAVFTIYLELGNGTTAGEFNWVIGNYNNGKHIVQIALNLPSGKESATCQKVVAGSLDAEISSTLKYLANLNSPVFLRFGGEMNLWQMDAALYKNAYIHIADMARKTAPNVALVFSPNSSSYWLGNMSDYYPGDEYVDWVGLSLYANYSADPLGTEYAGDMYFGTWHYADVVRSARQVVETFGGKKPIMVTEGGSIVKSSAGVDCSAFAANQIREFYATLNMVYPQIKIITYFDTDFEGDDYSMRSAAATKAAYQAGVAANSTLLKSYGQTPAATWRKLAGGSASASAGNILIGAFSDTVYSDKMTITYRLNGAQIGQSTATPYQLKLDPKIVTGGDVFSVDFDDGAGYTASKKYAISISGGTIKFTELHDAVIKSPSNWAAGEVSKATNLGLAAGLAQGGVINYTGNISRGDFCQLIVNNLEAVTKTSIDDIVKKLGSDTPVTFTDTTDRCVTAVAALGIVNGYGGGIFGENDDIQRQQAAKMLVLAQQTAEKYLNISKSSGKSIQFSDIDTAQAWAQPYIEQISSVVDPTNSKAVMGGVGNNIFDPFGSYTTEQAIVTSVRLYNSLAADTAN